MPALYPNLLQHQGPLLKLTAWHIGNIPCTSLLYCSNGENNSGLWEQVHRSTLLESQHWFRIPVNYRSNGDIRRCIWGKELTPCCSKGSGCVITIIQEWLIVRYLYCIVMLIGKNVRSLDLTGAIWFTFSFLCPLPEVTNGLISPTPTFTIHSHDCTCNTGIAFINI